MLLWVGLGNPEPNMAGQRHNIGFMAIDRIAARHGFSPWRHRFRGLVAEGSLEGEKILALKPLTYMNDSGELDLLPGRVRVKKGGGAAGHNGLRSMDRMLGSPDYWRVRLGIGHPGSKERVLGWVLGDFAKADQPWLDSLLDAVADSAPLLASGKPEEFMNRLALP